MSKLRIRRGDKVLGSTDADGLAEWLESGLISEYDLVAVGDGEDWQLIRDFVASQPQDGTDASAAATETVADQDDLPIAVESPSEPAPASTEESDSSYRPIWDVDEEEPEEEEPVEEIRIPKPPSSATVPTPDPVAQPRQPKRPSGTRSSGSVPVPPSGELEAADTAGIEESDIEAAFRKLLKWEAEAPAVADPAARSDPRVAARKSARRSDESGEHKRSGKKKKRRREGPPSDPEQPRRRQRRRS